MPGLSPKEGWSSFVLLLLMLLAVAWSLQAAEWVEGLHILQMAILLSVVLGLLLSKLHRLPGNLAHLLSFLLGGAWTMVLASTFLPPEFGWREKLDELAYRSWAWFQVAISGGVSDDELIFVMGLCFAFWVLGYTCAWYTFRRHQMWRVILPSGAALVINVYYAATPLTGYLVFYLFCVLLLAVRSHLYNREVVWQKAAIIYGPHVSFDFLRDGAVLSLIIILAAWVMPVVVTNPHLDQWLERLREPWQVAEDTWWRLFSSLKYRNPQVVSSFTRDLELGGPVHFGNVSVMDVRASKGRYWRAVVYDTYTGSGWINTDPLTLEVKGDDPRLAGTSFQLREEIVQTIRLYQAGDGLLVAAPQPIKVDRPVRTHVSALGRIEGPVDDFGPRLPLSPSMIYSQYRLRPYQPYEITSSVTKADVQSLRRARGPYPSWTERYLQLPDTLSQRIADLAGELTEKYDNVYDKATAIERYLRQITYNELVQAPPPDRDGVDYFLFDMRQGYCNYYASAMTVMLRTIGIPARLAAGYARGVYDSEADLYRIKDSDAHVWTEVFFPGYGWIEFEPTASEPLILRPERQEDTADRSDRSTAPRPPRERPEDEFPLEEDLGPVVGPGFPFPLLGIGSAGQAIAVMAAVLLLVSGVTIFVVQRGRGEELTTLEKIYRGMVRYASFMGFRQQAQQTPHEYGASLVEVMPEGKDHFLRLVSLYVKERFSPYGVNRAEETEAKGIWTQLRLKFWKRLLRSLVLVFSRRS